MEKVKKFTGTCSKCGNAIEHDYIECYEVSFFNNRIKKEILQKKEKYFVATCSKCHTEVVMAYPFRFIDPKRKYDILLVSYGHPSENELLNKFRSCSIESGWQTRLVANGTELAEKIQLFDTGMDDRVIEICKILLLGDLCEEEAKYREFDFKSCNYFRHSKDGSAYSGVHMMCYAYDVGEKRDAVVLQFEESYYQNVAKQLKPDFDAHALSPFEEVNAKWARKVLDDRRKRLGL